MTEIIIYNRPNNGGITISTLGNFPLPSAAYAKDGAKNIVISPPIQVINQPAASSGQGQRLDTFGDTILPMTHAILDIREPEKRKTSWSKSIDLPGTANNNRAFGHYYDLSKDGWITIGSQSVWQNFNPNKRLDILLVTEGIQTFKGNLKLMKVVRDHNNNCVYTVQLSGDLTSLFYDIGDTMLDQLDFSEWDHFWSTDNIKNSWSGILKKNGATYSNKTYTALPGSIRVTKVQRQASTGRTQFVTSGAHGLAIDDSIKITPNTVIIGLELFTAEPYNLINGEWHVAEIINTTTFTINYPYPMGLLNMLQYQTDAEDVPNGSLIIKKTSYNGTGYVYPMIDWGDAYDENSFPSTSFVPGYFAKEIWDKIFLSTNSKYVSNFIDSQFFKKLMIIQKRSEYKVSEDDIKSRTFRVGLDGWYRTCVSAAANGVNEGTTYWNLNTHTKNTATIIGPNNDFGQIYGGDGAGVLPLSVESGGSGTGAYCDGDCDGYDPTTGLVSYNNWDSSAYTWIVPKSGSYYASTSLNVSAWMTINGYTGNVADGTASMNPGQYHRYTPQNNTGHNEYPQGQLGENETGIRIVIIIKHKRNGQTINTHNVYKSFKTNPSQTWDNPITGLPPGWLSFGTYQPTSWQNQTIHFDIPTTNYVKGDEIRVFCKYYAQVYGTEYRAEAGRNLVNTFSELDYSGTPTIRNINADMFVQIQPPSSFWVSPGKTSTEGSIIEAKEFLPKDMSCKDFLTSIIKMFNLCIEQDKTDEKIYHIEPYNDFFRNGSNGVTDFVDWTNKTDFSSIDIQPMGALIAKDYIFTNRPETDFWNKKFKDERGRDYMSYKHTVDTDHLKNQISISVPFGSSVMINNPEGSDVVMPSIIQKDTNGVVKAVTNSAPRMLIWGGMRPWSKSGISIMSLTDDASGGAKGWEMLSSQELVGVGSTSSGAITNYPYAGTVDSPHDPHFDINWYNQEVGDFVYWDSARWSDANLYNKYWSDFIREISDPASAYVTADVNLRPADIADLDFKKIYVIDRNWFRLQKVIDYDSNSQAFTKVELLKLKTSTKWYRSSVWSGSIGVNVFGNPNPTTGVVTPTVLQAWTPPPKNKGTSKFGNSVEYATSVSVRGTGNVIGSARSVEVHGNENTVPSDSRNISIKGDGNTISPGLKNVSLIGTSKKMINESDVTYINNIRYKNGVPISKSNVIDGGSDRALASGSTNTIISYIDAGEDIVTSKSSSGFENVVDSGSDAILPDVAELGLTNNLTPNPKTNYSGGYQSVGVTQSLTDVIRTNRVNAGNGQSQAFFE